MLCHCFSAIYLTSFKNNPKIINKKLMFPLTPGSKPFSPVAKCLKGFRMV